MLKKKLTNLNFANMNHFKRVFFFIAEFTHNQLILVFQGNKAEKMRSKKELSNTQRIPNYPFHSISFLPNCAEIATFIVDSSSRGAAHINRTILEQC